LALVNNTFVNFCQLKNTFNF